MYVMEDRELAVSVTCRSGVESSFLRADMPQSLVALI